MTQIISKSLLASHIKTLSALTTHASAKAVKSLQRGLTGERELSGDKYMDNAELLGAYSAYYFPISYMQMSYALSALPLPVHKDSSFRLLDFGSGQGAATSALLDKIFTACPNASVSINLVDHSKKALELATSFLKKEYPSVSVKTYCLDVMRQNIPHAIGKIDIAVSCHLINELWQSADDRIIKRFALIKGIAQLLTDEGILCLTEPAMLKTSRELLELRDMAIREKLFSVIAPCSHNKACPALSAGINHTCHAEMPFIDVGRVKALADSAGLDRESVKMTFIIFSKAKRELEIEDDAKEKTTISGVVSSEGMLNKSGRIRYLICTEGKRVAVSAKKGDKTAEAIGFFSLKRLMHVCFKNLEIRENGNAISYGICEKTEISLKFPT